METIAFFGSRLGVGNTSLVYHLAWLYADRGIKVLVADFDPQADLSAMFLSDEHLVRLWNDGEKRTVIESLQPLIDRTGDIAPPHVENVAPRIGLLTGGPGLSRSEDVLSESWLKCLAGGDLTAFHITTAFHRILRHAAVSTQAELILIDVGPNLGVINRAAIIAAEHVVLAVAPALLSLQGLRNLGSTLRRWRKEWQERLGGLPADLRIDIPSAEMHPLGYVIVQDSVRDSRLVAAYRHRMGDIPGVYRSAVLNDPPDETPTVQPDPFCLSLLRHYRSLLPLAIEARKPMFFLKPADGTVGAHVEAVKACYQDFLALGKRISDEAGFGALLSARRHEAIHR